MFYIQEEGLLMGVPNSSLFSEISLQDLQRTKHTNILTKYDRLAYIIHANDILNIYEFLNANINDILEDFNIQKEINLKTEIEDKRKMNFSYTTLTKNCGQFKVATYRKPTTTDCIITNYLGWENISAKVLIFDRM